MNLGKSKAKVCGRPTPASPSATWLAWMKPGRAGRGRRLLKDPNPTVASADGCPKGVLLSAAGHRQDVARQRWPARRACRSSRSPARSSSRCSWASARHGCATCSNRPGQAPAIIFIDELDAMGRPRPFGGMGGHDERSRPSTSCWSTRRLRFVLRPGAAGRHQPPRGARPGAPAGRPFRPPGAGGPPDKEGPHRHPGGEKKITSPGHRRRPGGGPAPRLLRAPTWPTCATRRRWWPPPRRRRRDAGTSTVAIERIVAGLEKKNRVLNEHERTVVATTRWATRWWRWPAGTDPVHKISIIPRGVGALGYTIQRPPKTAS